jgi:hypothetical protein
MAVPPATRRQVTAGRRLTADSTLRDGETREVFSFYARAGTTPDPTAGDATGTADGSVAAADDRAAATDTGASA